MKKNKKEEQIWFSLLLIPFFLLISSGFLLFSNQAEIGIYKEEMKRSHASLQALQRALYLTVENDPLPPAEKSHRTNEISQTLESLENILGNVSNREEILARLQTLPSEDTLKGKTTRADQTQLSTLRDALTKCLEQESSFFRDSALHLESGLEYSRNLTVSLILLDTLALAAIAYMLMRLRQLNRVVTVCAWSKTIQHEGQWMSFEAYLQKQFGISVSHGMSEKIYEKLIKDTEEKNKT